MTPKLLLSHVDLLKAEIARRQRSVYCSHQPFEAQRTFLQLDCLEALYGGAAGSGKSDALLMAALRHVDNPGYSALLLRRTYRDLSLPGAIMDRAHQWLQPTDAHWNGIDKCWVFPSGAKLQFGYLDTEQDKYRYQGAELQFIGFDELTQFQESQYVYLLSRLRRLQGSKVTLRARSATNPGGIGHEWVYRRFVAADLRGSRAFVPATLAHNPYLDQEAYREALGALDGVTKRQLLHGEWVRDSAGLVYHYDDDRNGLDHLPHGSFTYYLGCDFGIQDHTAFTVIGWREYDQTVYVLESFGRPGVIPSEAARIVQELDERYKFERIIGDTGGMGKAYTEEFRRRYGIPIVPAEKQNKLGFISLLNGALEEGRIQVRRGPADQLINEWRALPWHSSHQKEHDGFANHCCMAEGTLISTDTGDVPIELICRGSKVCTPQGHRVVTAAWRTGMRPTWCVETQEGHKVFGTGDHPIFMADGTQRRIDALLYGDRLLVCPTSTAVPRSSNSTASLTGDIQPHLGETCASTGPHSMACASMWHSGKQQTAVCQPGIMSTMWTGTLSIIRSVISSAFRGAAMQRRTCRPSVPLCVRESWLRKLGQRLLNGIGPKLAWHFTSAWGRILGKAESLASTVARFAGWLSCPNVRLECAAIAVMPSGGETPGWMTKIGSAQAVAARSDAIGTANSDIAHAHVLRVTKTGVTDWVYNLTVEDQHCYYANGILVSNCDATLYAWRAAHAFLEGAEPCPTPALGSIAHYQAVARQLEESALKEWQRNEDERDLLP